MNEFFRGGADARDLADHFERAWNAHDMSAFAELFEPDAIFVSRFGHYWRGREEIAARHAEIHATIYRDCTIANRIQNVDPLSDDIAVVYLRSFVSVGPTMPVGPRNFTVQFSYVAVRREGAWHIRSAQNVAVADPRTGELLVEA